MKISSTLLSQGILAGIEVVSRLLKWERYPYSKHKETGAQVIKAGKDVAKTLVLSFAAFKDKKITPEEALILSDRVAITKRNLDTALTELIKDLRDYALERTEEEKANG